MSLRVANASPLLFLAKLERLELLRLGVEAVLVPSGVLAEIRAKRDAATKQVELSLGSWLKECPLTRPDLLRLLPDLGEGEKEVIAQALQENVVSVSLDDLDARRVARRLRLEPIGTVGLLLAAKKRAMLPSLKPELERLQTLGFWVSDILMDQSLREAGESEPV